MKQGDKIKIEPKSITDKAGSITLVSGDMKPTDEITVVLEVVESDGAPVCAGCCFSRGYECVRGGCNLGYAPGNKVYKIKEVKR